MTEAAESEAAESIPTAISPVASETSGVAVLDRAFALLGAFGSHDDALTLTELSRRTGLYKSTVLRLLAALEHGGFIRKVPDGQYAIGPEPLRLATIYQRSFRLGDVVEKILEALSAATGETASYYVRSGADRIAVFRVEPARAVRASVAVGQAYPVGQGASGKVLLAFTEPAGGEHQRIRQRLWAVSYGERDPETASVAAPVFAITGFQGALTLSGPRDRLSQPDTMLGACRQLLNAAAEGTRALGGDAAPFVSGASSLSRSQFELADAGSP